jgi:hypothetical protein
MVGPEINSGEQRQGEAGGACGVRVVCIGETMVMFAPRPHELIE